MDTMWVAATLTVAGMMLTLYSRMLRPRVASLGTMNDRWLAEQRLLQPPDPNR